MSIYNMLFDWQKKLVDKHQNENWGLWLDMGLGKTPISLAFAEKQKADKILIITINSKVDEGEDPSSFESWIKQLEKEYKVIKKSYKKSSFENEAFITNYEHLFKRSKSLKSSYELREDLTEFIKNCKAEKVTIIIDESHKMKDSSSIQTKCIIAIKKALELIAKDVKVYLLSGTPFTQGYIDLYTQLKFLGYETTKTDFKNTFCVLGQIKGLLGWQQPIVGYKNVDGLYNIIHRFCTTTLSSDVIDLPEQIYKSISSPVSEPFEMFTLEKVNGLKLESYMIKRGLNTNISYSDKLVNNPFYRNIDYPNNQYLADTPGNFWLRARQLSIGFQGNSEDYIWYDKTRLNQLEKFLEENPDNYLLFYNYTPELFEIFKICEKLKYNIDIYSGDIKSLYFYEKYASETKDEQFNNKRNIILANFASGSTGKNWQLYNKCIVFSTPLYKDWAQGIKRIHRMGQKNTVFYYRFYQRNWLDYSMKIALDNQEDYNIKMFQWDLKEENKE